MENKFTDLCEWTKETYERTVAGTINEEELLEELILFLKAGYRIPEHEGLYWGNQIDDARVMPRDVFCELIAEPTHRVAALMMYGWSHYKSIRDFEPLKNTLIGALQGALVCGFRGHGYEAEEVFEKNMNVYENAKTHLFIDKYYDLYPQFTDEYVNLYGEFCIKRKCYEERK